MISEKGLARACRPAILGRARIIAQREGNIWKRSCSYDGRLTRVEANVDSSSGDVDHYHASITMDEAADVVRGFSCTCPAAHRFPGPCKHSIALALDFNRHAGEYDGFDALQHVSTSTVLGEYLDRATASSRSHGALGPATDEAPGSIRIETTVVHERDMFARFRVVGSQAAYVVRDVSQLARDVESGGFRRYGNRLAFAHGLDMFEPRSRAVAEFLVRAVQNRRAFAGERIYGRVFGTPGAQQAIGREIRLSDPEFDELVDMYAGDSLDFQPEGAAAPLVVAVTDGDPECGLGLVPSGDDAYELVRSSDVRFYATASHLYAYGSGTLYRCSEDLRPVSDFLTGVYSSTTPHLLLGGQDVGRFAAIVLPRVRGALDVEVPPAVEARLPAPLRLVFSLDHTRSGVTCAAEAVYGDRRYPVLAREGGRDDYARDLEAEVDARRAVGAYFSIGHAGVATIPDRDTDAMARLLAEGLPRLRELGEVRTSEAFDRLVRHGEPRVRMGVSVRSNLIRLDVSASDLPLSELYAILGSYRRHQRFHRLRDGSFIDLAGVDLSEADRLADELGLTAKELSSGSVRIPSYKAFLLDHVMSDEEKDVSFEEYVAGFRSVDPAGYEPPASIAPRLRPYQVAGFQWLSALCDMGFGGVLADEMGLGKSVQMISLLVARRGRGESLVVCPASLVYNWVAEFEKFAPELDVAPVVGTAPERRVIRRERHEVLVTSYDLLRRDVEDYAAMDFWCEVLDEAQYIKNHETLAARAVKVVPARHRFALTGTPIENRLSELWSIFDYLMPGLLGSHDRFRERYEDPILEGDARTAERLHAAIGPFMLRRRKRDVLRDLPDKLEQVVYARLDGEQRRLYAAHEQALRLSLTREGDDEFGREKIQVLAELTRLRQICCDPRLVYDDYDGPSAKLDTIVSLVERVVDAQAKALVFSQFTSYLDLIARRLDAEGIAYYVLTGSTPKRRRLEMVDAFNGDDTPVFLISLKAGGTGLNLTGASVVVHADPWWNAAAQNQATDRAHRIGQTREVTVYKVIARDTIEDRILELQEAKTDLAEQVVGEGGGMSLASLRREDLIELLGY